MKRNPLFVAWGLLPAFLLAGCGESSDTPPDPPADAAIDAKGDASPDATTDSPAEPDATPDAGPDAQTDAEPDAATDATEPDAEPDSTEPDTGPDPNDVDDDSDGYTENEGDCDDDDPLRSPGLAEVCDNDIDDDCDGVVDDVGGTSQTLGPLPYLQASDSPWHNDPSLTEFILEDFEDKTLPDGVTASTFSWSSSFGAGLVDSVDGDDGDPTNGQCSTCDAMWAGGPITFTFDEAVLGHLPTHVGIVLTDSGAANVTVTLSATSTCESFEALQSSVTFGDGGIGGATAEDRFVGFVSPAGITTFTVSIGTAVEVDHLQFGW